MSMTKDEAKKATGAKLAIFVYLGESRDPAFLQIEDSFPVAELKNRIRKVLKNALREFDTKALVVWTKDATDALHLLADAKLTIAEALTCNSEGQYEVYVKVSKVESAEKRARTERLVWDPSLAKYKTVGDVPLPPLETKPEFVAPAGWLGGFVAKVREEYKKEDEKSHTRPLCVARCSRGGKTRALKELAYQLQLAGIPVLFVTFNNWGTLGKYSHEQADPLQALLVRIAFLATHDVTEWAAENFYTFRASYHVPVENVQAWLGKDPCVLIIDEMNAAIKLGVACEEGAAFVDFLRASFLAPIDRTLVFSSHIVETVHQFDKYLAAAKSLRAVLVEPLPNIANLKIARAAFGNLTIQEFLYQGLIPALVETRAELPSWVPDEEFKIDEAGVRKLFLSFFTGAPDLIDTELLQFMDTVSSGRVLWIMSRMKMVFGTLSSRFRGSEMGRQLVELRDLIQFFLDSKAQAGDGFEILFAFAFVLRAGCGCLCKPFFPSLSSTPWSFSINRHLETGTPLNEIETWAELKTMVLPPSEVSFPHVAYLRPTHGSFHLYDGFALMYDKPGAPPFATLAFQMKRGRATPDEDAEDGLSSFLIRGDPSGVEKGIRGWRFVSGDELVPFFGESGSQWVPDHMDALE